MFIKLGIIAGIIVLGGMIFSNEIDTLFPSTSATVVDSIKEDVSNISSKTVNSVEQRIDDSVDQITEKTANAITNEINEVGEKIQDEISDVKESSQKAITNFDPLESIKNTFSDWNFF